MNMRTAEQRLDERGSTQDPIFHGGEETTFERLIDRVGPYADAGKVEIEYFARVVGRTSGTVEDMVFDREFDDDEVTAEVCRVLDGLRDWRVARGRKNLPTRTLTHAMMLISKLYRFYKKHGGEGEAR